MQNATSVGYSRYDVPAELDFPTDELVVDEETSVICTDCSELVDGVEAGSRVLWVLCNPCKAKREAPPATSSVELTPGLITACVVGLILWAIVIRFIVVWNDTH